jgi:drug/metabolite transporter superfamily protein YnfA
LQWLWWVEAVQPDRWDLADVALCLVSCRHGRHRVFTAGGCVIPAQDQFNTRFSHASFRDLH